MGPEVNVELPVVNMEGQDPLPLVVEIDDPDTPQYPSMIAQETALEFPAVT